MKPACLLTLFCTLFLAGASARSAEPLSKRLAEIVAIAKEVDLVAPDHKKGNWCKNGKPIHANPIRKTVVNKVFSGSSEVSKAARKILGKPKKVLVVGLRERDCPGMWTFRVRINELTYPTEEDAQKALEGLLALRGKNDSVREFKRVHGFWVEGPKLYLAFSKAFKHWKRFRKFRDLIDAKP